MPMHIAETYEYRVVWSEELRKHVGLCGQFPLLSAVGRSHVDALNRIIDRVMHAVDTGSWLLAPQASPGKTTVHATAMLETAALGYAEQVRTLQRAMVIAEGRFAAGYFDGAREFLATSALSYASAMGALDAAQRAELRELRRFREGVVSLRAALAAGKVADDEPIEDASKVAIESIDALLMLHGGAR